MSKKKTVNQDPNVETDRLENDEAGDDLNNNNESVDETNQEAEEAATKGSMDDEELNVRYLRLAADFQNYRRRVEKEKNDIYAYANEKIVVELLDVIDNFERALDHSTEAESFAEGMSMIFKQLKGVLEKSGVEEIQAAGETFDPNFHHAVLTENSVEHEAGKVTQVLQKGYLLNKKVIRPAMVKVAE